MASQIQDALEGAEEAPGVLRVKGKKHPKLRAWTGLLALLVGFALVAGSLGSALGQLVNQGNPEWWKSDWQETAQFRTLAGKYVKNFLTLGAGGELTWYDTLLADIWSSDNIWGWDTSTSTAVEVYEGKAPEPDEVYQWDKNVLYQVLRDNKRLYANTDQAIAYAQGLPEGYNFLLIFRDGKARAWKDGKELDLYGDGVYTEDSPWYLPGYENFTAGEDVADVEVRMAVRQEPIPYLQGQYAAGYVDHDSSAYDLFRSLEEARQDMLTCAVAFIAGLFVLSLAFFWREDRRRAEAAIAAKTRYVWTEFRFLAVAVCLLWAAADGIGSGYFSVVYSALYRWLGAGSWPDVISAPLAYGLSLLLGGLPGVLALCLVLWLIHNDHRYNPKPRRSLLGGFFRVLRDSQFRLPVQQRLRRWALTPAAAMVLGAAAMVLLLVMGVNLFWWNVYFAYVLLTILGFLLILALCILSARHQLSLARDIGRLADQTAAIRDGNLNAAADLPADTDLHQIAEDLSQIQTGLQKALEARTRSERMKVELISNVSHDLKTPLTSILSYAELLRQEPLEGAAADYARIIDEKAQRLKGMVQDVFEVSKAAADQLPVHLERLDFAKLVRQTLADMADPIEKSGLTFRVELPEGEVPITADGKRMYRVFQNLIQNALQYALPGSRVYVTLTVSGSRAETAVRNTSCQELPKGVDFTARFVRGDASRTDGGSGLGLSIARSFTEACGGQFRVETVADLFTAAVSFPLAGEGASQA